MPLLATPSPVETSATPSPNRRQFVVYQNGKKNERVSPAKLLLTSQNALTEVCAKEGKNEESNEAGVEYGVLDCNHFSTCIIKMQN